MRRHVVRCLVHNLVWTLVLANLLVFGLAHTDKPSIQRPGIEARR